jgi:protein-S-isoprenylcysteine O-methyltransferase Ste14
LQRSVPRTALYASVPQRDGAPRFRHREKRMNVQNILWTSIVLFGFAAAGGLVMAGIRVSGDRNPPAWLAMLHGLLAAAGLTLLIYTACTVGLPQYALWGVILLVLAALGGLYLNLGYQERRELLPKTIVYGHAAIAVVGFLLVLFAAMQTPGT